MSLRNVEKMLAAINEATGGDFILLESHGRAKVVDQQGREMVGRGWIRAEELGHRVEAVLYFLQRSDTENAVMTWVERTRVERG